MRRLAALLLMCWPTMWLFEVAPFGQPPAASNEVRLEVPGARRGSLALAADGQIVALGWLASEGSTNVLTIAVSKDGGRRFGPPKRIGNAVSVGSSTRPVLAVQPSTDPKSGTRPRILAALPASRGEHPGVLQFSSGDLGQSFEETFVRPNGLPAKAIVSALTFGPSGRLHALWMANSTLLYARAGTISDARRLDEAASRCGVSAIAIGPDTSISVMWYRAFAQGDEEFSYVRSAANSDAFGAPVRVSRERWGFKACPGAFPSLTVDASGNIRFVFQAATGTAPARSSFFVDRSSDGGTFRPRAFVDAPGFDDVRSPQLVPDGNGGLALVWDGVRNDRRYLVIRHSLGAPGGSGGLDADWMRPAPPIVLDHSGGGVAPVAARVPNGIVAAWLSGSQDKVTLAVRRLGIDELCGLPPASR